MDSGLVLGLVQGKFMAHNHRRERNMHELGLEFEMDHLRGQVLSSCVVNCEASILAAGHQEVTSS